MNSEVFLPFLFFWNSLRRMGINISLNVWTMWYWTFVCWEYFYYWFMFFTGYQSVQIFYFFLYQFWYFICFQELTYYFKIIQFIGIQFFIIISHNFLYFCSVDCFLSTLIIDFIYWVFLFYFWWFWLEVYQ